MSSLGRYVPISLAIAFGVFNGYYAFSGPLKAQQEKPISPDAKQQTKSSPESASTKEA
ncbi:hypothetical protein F4810DRAFT_667457 [Camillea tinctor]|nr:hypothetical protein F4810DRAFT_667457 [Camillea tinctor]